MSAMVVCMVLASITVTGMVYDGGVLVSEYARLADVSGNAARLGAQHVTGIRSGNPHIDLRDASIAVRKVLGQFGASGTVDIVDGAIVVSTRKTVPLRVFAIFGFGSRQIAVTRRVDLVGG